MSDLKKELLAIVRRAEKEKFGRTSNQQWRKRIFLDGVKYVILSLDGGKEVLDQLGYLTQKGNNQ